MSWPLGHDIPSETEQAYPINGNWLNHAQDNLNFFGNWNTERWENESELELAKQIKTNLDMIEYRKWFYFIKIFINYVTSMFDLNYHIKLNKLLKRITGVLDLHIAVIKGYEKMQKRKINYIETASTIWIFIMNWK